MRSSHAASPRKRWRSLRCLYQSICATRTSTFHIRPCPNLSCQTKNSKQPRCSYCYSGRSDSSEIHNPCPVLSGTQPNFFFLRNYARVIGGKLAVKIEKRTMTVSNYRRNLRSGFKRRKIKSWHSPNATVNALRAPEVAAATEQILDGFAPLKSLDDSQTMVFSETSFTASLKQ